MRSYHVIGSARWRIKEEKSKGKNIVGKIRNKTDLARMKEYSSKVWFGTIKKTCIKSYLMYRVFRSFYSIFE